MTGPLLWDVDTQVDFVHAAGKLPVPGAEDAVPAMAKLVRWAEEQGIPHLATADDHELTDPEISDEPDFEATYPPHCLRGTPGAARVGNYKAVFNLRGDDGAPTGGLAVDTNLGWKGAAKYVATVPQVFDLWQDPQERYDIFMNNYTERTWTLVTISESIKELMKTYVKYPPRKLQSEGYDGPIEISRYQRFQWVREQLAKEGMHIAMPTGN